MSFQNVQGTELVATEDIFLTADYSTHGDKTIVGAHDPRAAILLVRKGDSIPDKLAKRLGITKDSKIDAIPAAQATIATEDIESRSTRPEPVKAKR